MSENRITGTKMIIGEDYVLDKDSPRDSRIMEMLDEDEDEDDDIDLDFNTVELTVKLSQESLEILDKVYYCAEKSGISTQELLNAVMLYAEKYGEHNKER